MPVRMMCSLMLCLACLCASPGTPGAMARPATGQQNPRALVATYYQILNAGLRSGDFSAMASVFALDATVTRSTPTGATITLHGLGPIINFYRTLYVAAPGTQFQGDVMYSLSPAIVLTYEHTRTAIPRAIARCSHLFVVENGRIKQLFWVVYYAGRG